MKHVIYTLLTISILSACTSSSPKKLPILGPRTTVERQESGKMITDTVYATIPKFMFLNQDSVEVTEEAFKGKIYVADFFFTTCPSICPIMHRNLLKVYEKYKDNPEIMLASHTIDYKHDYPSVMKKYATKLGVEGTQWEFLWGARDSVYKLAEKNYLVAVSEDKNAPGGYVHQGWLVLVDKERRIRGAYDGTVDEQVNKLLKDMDVLLQEYRSDEK